MRVACHGVTPLNAIRTERVLFSGQEPKSEQKDSFELQDLETQINERYGSTGNFIRQVATDQNLIGEGGESRVYEIPDMPAYVLSVSKFPPFETLPDKTPDLNLGQPVAQVNAHYKILKKQKGYATKLHPWNQLLMFPSERWGVRAVVYIQDADKTSQYRQAYQEFIELVAAIPQSGYDELAKNLSKIHHHPNVFFDADASNVLVDSEKGKFNLVDCERENVPNSECLFGMLTALLNGKFVSVDETAVQTTGRPDEQSVATDPYLINLRREVVKKCLIAAYRSDLPILQAMRNKVPFMQKYQWGYEEYLFRVSGLQGKWPDVYKLLIEARQFPEMNDVVFQERLKVILEKE